MSSDSDFTGSADKAASADRHHRVGAVAPDCFNKAEFLRAFEGNCPNVKMDNAERRELVRLFTRAFAEGVRWSGRPTAAFWRADAFQSAADIVRRYAAANPNAEDMAREIEALKPTRQ